MHELDIVANGPVIGQYKDFPIYEWVESRNGTRFDYLGVIDLEADEPVSVTVDDIIYASGIHYRHLKEAGEASGDFQRSVEQ